MPQSDAVGWLRAKIGQHLDYDNQYGQQCVDFFNFFYQYVTGDSPYGAGYSVPGAKDLWNVPNSRLTKIPDSPTLVPQAGDIAVYGPSWGAGFGHVEVVLGTDGNGCTFVGENEHGNPSEGVVEVYRTWAQMRGLLGVMRFQWAAPPPPEPPVPVTPIPVPTPPAPYVPPAAPVPIVKAEKYELLTTLPYFASLDEAMKDKNAVSTIDAGTYYVWAKGGSNSQFYNLTTDNTKNQNRWINIVDNKKPLNTPAPVPVSTPVDKPVETEGDVRKTYVSIMPDGSGIDCEVLQNCIATDRLQKTNHIYNLKVGQMVKIFGTFSQGGRWYARVKSKSDPEGLYMFGIPIAGPDNLGPYLEDIYDFTDRIKYGWEKLYDKVHKTIDGFFKPKKLK